MRRPMLPSELYKQDQLQPWRRLATAKAFAAVTGKYVDNIIGEFWGEDPRAAEAIQKAAVAPASTTGWGSALAVTAVGAFLHSLRPRSAAAQLFLAPLSMAGVLHMLLPRMATDWPEPKFIAEGGPIPAVQGSFGGATLGPPAKLAMLTGITGELARYSVADAEALITELMDDAAARALDAAVFSTTAASAVRPAGLLNGVTEITATSGGGQAAMVSDIKLLVGAINAAGGGTSIILFANPVQGVALNMLANASGYQVVLAPSLAPGTVIAIEQAAIASGFNGLPAIETSQEAVIHFEDTTPLAIGTAGAPATVAAPTRSAFQSDMLVLRMILPCAWTPRASGMVQYLTGATW